ncbi:L-threonylcarbamoyladenylate synthase [Ostreibacterium oceani]|uniref:Threonylcarbamoyl-AMP synthase n=1 Tax=Ostreibacterium oceani TaxID=2654998 RepID=A0A6N7EY42_9GAMM|nr:L-threonylcarbamoyladenylate synthase [Ostreibacterium oceani]MPV86047.1 threonylcarbamoyl-AMP synthase [Ostreibacterium oceani]
MTSSPNQKDKQTTNQTSTQIATQIATQINDAVTIIRQAGVICYPTEGVWGLGCDPQSPSAIQKLLQAKSRPADKGLILVASQFSQIEPYITINAVQRSQLDDLWPGFVTCLLPKSSNCPALVTGNHETIAIRISEHPIIVALCDALNAPLISTSANISGKPPVANLNEAKQVFAQWVEYFIDAPLGGHAKPSQIVDLTKNTPVILRQ